MLQVGWIIFYDKEEGQLWIADECTSVCEKALT